MKIFCVGRNYAAHAAELNNAIPDKPVIFMKPQTALLKENKPFYIPDFSKDIHYETELVFRVSKNGKSIEEKFALKYIDAITVGIDFTARDIQNECKTKGLPWELAKAFDNSAVIGTWINLETITDIHNINFCMYRNRTLAQKGNSKDMLFPIEKIISFISQYFTLQQGDLIYTGTPVGVASIAIEDKIEAFIENDSLLEFDIK
jgi:2-keto-4-pentenoate hydratase/2-oxohepta-3-ene-1,7-dioic acid hydratase in catechol pathway